MTAAEHNAYPKGRCATLWEEVTDREGDELVPAIGEAKRIRMNREGEGKYRLVGGH
jgi:hypothetical protein